MATKNYLILIMLIPLYFTNCIDLAYPLYIKNNTPYTIEIEYKYHGNENQKEIKLLPSGVIIESGIILSPSGKISEGIEYLQIYIIKNEERTLIYELRDIKESDIKKIKKPIFLCLGKRRFVFQINYDE